MFPRRGKGQTVADETLYVEDVFSAYTYAGTSMAQSIVNGIDLAGNGGLVWLKNRSTVAAHYLTDTVRGNTSILQTTSTAAQITSSDYVTGFNSDGFALGGSGNVNQTGNNFVGWTFRKAARFFHEEAKSHTNGVASTVDLSVLGTVGMVVVKRTDGTGDWWVWHRSLTAGNNLRLNLTDAQSTTNAHLSVSGTTLTIASGMATGTYIVYAWAHDTASDGIIQCGSFTGVASINLGWEAQYVLVKRTDVAGSWYIVDTARGFDLSTADKPLLAESNGAEFSNNQGNPTSTGFNYVGSGGNTYVYMAIRKGLMRTPTDATKVFEIVARTGTGAAATISLSGIKTGPDLVIAKRRTTTATAHCWSDRLRGTASQLTSDSTAAETTNTNAVTAWKMDGIGVGSFNNINNSGSPSYINYFLKQARGYFDVVDYMGTGSTHTEPHNLGVVPELIIVKRRSASANWAVYYGDSSYYMFLNTTAARANASIIWGNPTDSNFSVVGGFTENNAGSSDYVAYLFASCPGVSKVGAYTGTGAAQDIPCGFTAGARFVLIKRIDSTGDWYYWDTTRGIISGNDPYLLMNSTAAEVTSTDYIEPYSAGFALDATAPAALNASGGTFLFLAFA